MKTSNAETDKNLNRYINFKYNIRFIKCK